MPENESHLKLRIPEGISRKLGERKVSAAKAVLAEHGYMVVSEKVVEGFLRGIMEIHEQTVSARRKSPNADISSSSSSMAIALAQENILILIAHNNGLDGLEGLQKKFGLEYPAVEVE